MGGQVTLLQGFAARRVVQAGIPYGVGVRDLDELSHGRGRRRHGTFEQPKEQEPTGSGVATSEAERELVEVGL